MPAGPPIEFVVEPEAQGERLDQFVRRRIPGLSRGSLTRLLDKGQILVDGRERPKGLRLAVGQRVLVAAAATDERPPAQPELPLQVLAERADLVVVNKPAGVPCHPLVPGETDTVANAIVARYPECADASPHPREAGLVHRLDTSTSGVLVAARNRLSYGTLRALFGNEGVHKTYLALVHGTITRPGEISLALEGVPGDRTRVQVVPQERGGTGQAATTRYAPVCALGAFTLLRIGCRTGRRHQVRVHLAHVGHPLVGDLLYGGSPFPGVEGAFLHGLEVTLLGQRFSAPLPAERRRLLETLGWDGRLGPSPGEAAPATGAERDRKIEDSSS